MIEGKRILAVVPARSGSKGIPDKNMRLLGGISLIGRAGLLLADLSFIDRAVISTDSPEYAAEAKRYHLEAPFLRPKELSSDTAGAVETVRHALDETEKRTGEVFDIILIVEPTSPLRLPADITNTVRRLIDSGADSVVTVSELPAKAHPRKVLTMSGDTLSFFEPSGRDVVGRQGLEQLYWRNGVCYALTRECLVEQAAIFGARCVGETIDHPVVNIDEPWELEWADFLIEKEGGNFESK